MLASRMFATFCSQLVSHLLVELAACATPGSSTTESVRTTLGADAPISARQRRQDIDGVIARHDPGRGPDHSDCTGRGHFPSPCTVAAFPRRSESSPRRCRLGSGQRRPGGSMPKVSAALSEADCIAPRSSFIGCKNITRAHTTRQRTRRCSSVRKLPMRTRQPDLAPCVAWRERMSELMDAFFFHVIYIYIYQNPSIRPLKSSD